MNTNALHLTEDQLEDHLIGDLAAPAAAHLAACALCTARVAEASSPIASFQAVSLAWSERISATAPMPSVASARALLERRLVWSMAVALCAAGLSLTGLTHRIAAPAPIAASHTATAPTAAEISRDNQLLRTIDSELDASTESPAALGLAPVSTTTRARAANTAYQD